MVRVAGSRVGVVGGSIAGCAAAIALGRLGCDVHVFERSSGKLRDRGAGVMLSPTLLDELMDKDYLPAQFPTCPLVSRLWIVADGSPGGRTLWEQPGAAAATNWGVLWRTLRAKVPDDRYVDGMQVIEVHPDTEGVRAIFAGGSSESFDVLIGADGYRSLVRTYLSASSHPEYAGYIAWRGTYPEERLDRRAVVERGDARHAWFFVGFGGGHSIVYTVPSFENRTDSGHRRVNWLVYTQPPAGLNFDAAMSIPPGEVTPELYRSLERLLEEAFPLDFQDLIRASHAEEVSIQPIYDQFLDSYVRGRAAVVGDAGSVCRPHTASGSIKALQDALCLERLGNEHEEWSDLLGAYDHERAAAGASLVELGRRIGHDQVQQRAEWARLTASDMPAWTSETLAGASLYFYGEPN